jgi:hypothetical protein
MIMKRNELFGGLIASVIGITLGACAPKEQFVYINPDRGHIDGQMFDRGSHEMLYITEKTESGCREVRAYYFGEGWDTNNDGKVDFEDITKGEYTANGRNTVAYNPHKLTGKLLEEEQEKASRLLHFKRMPIVERKTPEY